ncbi:terminase [Methylovirgula ligni]|uniref:Phage terminase large subunit-like protein n=1 Tax=Methylovirgula ligni TaxID=569860 RepID=A0A3D9YQY3_9HYPH|nr:terminase TerL endonuclease subunit [Methylovirgula ligni]QAY96696.1 terminase [Methylovirgula ligni]REF83262.1 phage terminase large subunit-like protein [Methylovirgula ligni]
MNVPAPIEDEWSFACPDWWERLQQGRSLLPSLPLDKIEADRAVGIYNKFCLPDVTGNPSLGEVGGDWFRDFIRAFFGSLDRNGRRRVKKALGLVPKKQSKTTNSAALMLTGLLMNKRPRADFINVAPTKLLAEIAYEQAVGMIDSDPEGYLQKRFRPRDHLKQIDDLLMDAVWKIRAFDLNVTNGIIPAGILIDELHLIARDPNAARVIGQLIGGMLPILESFCLYITSQSDEPPVGVFKTELSRARAIRDGRIKGDLLPFLYEFPTAIQEDDSRWLDQSIWHCVLPNLRRSVQIEDLASGLREAEFAGKQEVARWASQHLNIQIGSKQASDSWPGVEYWDLNEDPSISLETLIAHCELIVPGVDGGGLDDLLGLNCIGIEKGTGRWLSWAHAWAHEIVKERRKSIVSQLEDFEKDGDLTFVTQMKTAYDECADLIAQIDAAGLIGLIGFDPAGASGVVKALAERGIEGDERIFGVRQGYSLAGPVKDVETKLADGELIHAAQPLMTWCAGNAKIQVTQNGYIVTKQASGTAKIDPLMALFNAAGVLRANPQPVSAYSADHGLYIF